MSRTDDDELFYHEVGARIKAARTRRGISQSQLAKRLDLSRASIGNIENGRQRIQLHTVAWIAFELGVTTHALLPASIDTTRDRGTVRQEAGTFTDDSSRSFVEGLMRSSQDGKGPA